ncbi:metallophosphoesterase [uncultured Ruminococcus sp.]|uniref:metallophosphoesterase family protein n=1 Tax=uncultured Ruminococcus sp. TaxID=165186 RepID=UPI00292F9EE5|nr:metallophosphoesterase [uncultured Ruminococcus sp.]
MKILAVADVKADRFYEYYKPGKLDEFDLILSCGDLRPEYLEFLVTMARCPLVYVHGNHDDSYGRDPQGCICADDMIVDIGGLRILGLGGANRYRDGAYMYTEREMARRIRKLWYPLHKHKGFDILLTHAPARHLNDFETIPHRGFECFNSLMERYEPMYFIHGHIHRNYGVDIPQICEKGATTVVNAYEYCIIDTDR